MTTSSRRRSRTSTAVCAPKSANVSVTDNGSPNSRQATALRCRPRRLPTSDRMHELGFRQRVIDIERDSWILVAAQIPEQVPALMAIKHAQIEHETLRELYLDLGDLADCAPDDPRLPSLADRVAAFLEAVAAEAVASRRRAEEQPISDDLVALLDAAFIERSPARRACSSSSRSAGGRAGPTSHALVRYAQINQ